MVSLSSKRGSRGAARTADELLYRRHREVISVVLFAVFCASLCLQGSWLLDARGEGAIVGAAVGFGGSALPPCPPMDAGRLRDGLVCVERCRPAFNNTLVGLGLDPDERVNISLPVVMKATNEYGKYRVHFPEERIHLNLTGRLSKEIRIAAEKAGGEDSVVDDGYLQPRSVTERLLRRVVAKLLRAGVLDPSKSIVNTGSWIGDNALPWALMLETLHPENPGKVIAIDPSERYVSDMVDLANVNGVGNLCARIGILSSNNSRVAFIGTSTEHIKVHTEENVNGGSWSKRERFKYRATWTDAITLDSLGPESTGGVSLIHLDVEGHEGEVLEGARATISSSRPIVITEGYDVWPEPKDENDARVLRVLTELGYEHASEIREYVGVHRNARNRIWWPDKGTRERAMAVVGRDLEKSWVVPWVSADLPE